MIDYFWVYGSSIDDYDLDIDRKRAAAEFLASKMAIFPVARIRMVLARGSATAADAVSPYLRVVGLLTQFVGKMLLLVSMSAGLCMFCSVFGCHEDSFLELVE